MRNPEGRQRVRPHCNREDKGERARSGQCAAALGLDPVTSGLRRCCFQGDRMPCAAAGAECVSYEDCWPQKFPCAESVRDHEAHSQTEGRTRRGLDVRRAPSPLLSASVLGARARTQARELPAALTGGHRVVLSGCCTTSAVAMTTPRFPPSCRKSGLRTACPGQRGPRLRPAAS